MAKIPVFHPFSLAGPFLKLRRVFVLALLLATPGGALAQSARPPLPDTAKAFGEVLQRFVTDNKLQKAIIVVRKNGARIYALGIGNQSPEAVVNVASLSKAITGACIGTLMRDGLLGIDTPLSEAAPKLLKSVPAFADERMKAATIAQLLTHTAGLAGNNNDGEAATGAKSILFDRKYVTLDPHQFALTIAKAALAQKLKYAAGTYHYSNDGYAILGRVIEEKTGENYGPACIKRVIAPAGAKAELSGVTASTDSYAGWRIAPEDYLKVFERVTTGASIIGPAMLKWKSSPQPYNVRGGGLWYGPGLFIRHYANSHNQFHWGSWRARHPVQYGFADFSFNAFAVRVGFLDLSYFVYFEPELPEEKRLPLEGALWSAVVGVKNWARQP